MKLQGIELKPGMIIKGLNKHNHIVLGVIFPFNDGTFGFIDYYDIYEYYNDFNSLEKIYQIYDVPDRDSLTSGKILWTDNNNNKVKYTKKDIAIKLGINIDSFEIID